MCLCVCAALVPRPHKVAAFAHTAERVGGTQPVAQIGCGQMKWGQHQWGRCESNEFWQIVEKGTPWHFWEDQSRLTGVPEKSLCQKALKIWSDPFSADPICPFPTGHSELRCHRHLSVEMSPALEVKMVELWMCSRECLGHHRKGTQELEVLIMCLVSSISMIKCLLRA